MDSSTLIPVPPPTRYSDLGPFTTRPDSVPYCCGTCRETSFTLTTTPCVGCATDYLVDGTAYRVMGQPGWYTFQRVLSNDPLTVLIMLQVVQNTAIPVFLTADNPWAIGYVDLLQGYSVYFFVGRAPGHAAPCYAPAPGPTGPGCCAPSVTLAELAAETRTTCRPWQAYVAACGPGCPSLVLAPELPCPQDNIGGQCRAPCDMLVVGVRAPAAPDVSAQVLIAVLAPVHIAEGDPPVVVRLTDRTCTSITPATAGQDFKITFSESFPGLTYLQLTDTGAGTTLVEANSMLTLDAVTPVPTTAGDLGDYVSPEPDCCSLTLYNICTQYDAAEALAPFVTVVAQVIWGQCDVSCMVSSQICKPLRLEGDGCCTFGLDVTVLTVDSEEDLILQLTTPGNYACGEDPNEPALEFIPIPGPGPAPCPAPGTAPPGSTVRNAKLVGADATSVRVLLPDGAVTGMWFAVGPDPDLPGLTLTFPVVAGLDNLVLLVVTNGASHTVYNAATGAVVAVALAASGSLVANPYLVSPLFAWTSDSVAGSVVTSVAVAQPSHAPPFLATDALVYGTSGFPWWVKPASGTDLTSAVNSAGLVQDIPGGNLSTVPRGTYGGPGLNSGLVLLGTHVNTSGAPVVVYYLFAVTVSTASTVEITQAALTSAGARVTNAACMADIALQHAATIPVGVYYVAADVGAAGNVDVFVSNGATWLNDNPSWTSRTAVSAQPNFLTQPLEALQFVGSLDGTIAAQLAQGANWRVSGAPATTCPPTTSSLLSYLLLGSGAAANQLDPAVQGVGAYFHGDITVTDLEDAALYVASSSQWGVDAFTAPPALASLRLGLNAGDVVITGVMRRDSGAHLWVTAVATVEITMSSLCFTTSSWGNLVSDDAYVCYTILPADNVGPGTLLFMDIDLANPAGSTIDKVLGPGFPRTTTPVLGAVTAGSNPIPNPYTSATSTFLTFFSGPVATASAATSATLSAAYTGATLPAGLQVPDTALQRTILFFNRPPADQGWVLWLGDLGTPASNVFEVFDWSGVSQYCYAHACLRIVDDPNDFLDALLWFNSVVG